MKFIKIFAFVALFAIIFVSCEKQELRMSEPQEGIDKTKLELVDENYELDGTNGVLYTYGNTNQKIFISTEKKKVKWHHTVYTTQNSVSCTGEAKNCNIYTEGDGVCIRVRNENY